MQRVAWTDERLDDLSQRMDAGFDRVDTDIRELRGDMNAGFTGLRQEMRAGQAELREEMKAGDAELRGDMSGGFAELRTLMWRMTAGIVTSVVIASLLHGI